MNANIFVDTNILVYARDSSEGEKQTKALNWLGSLWKNENGKISAQVLNEYYVTVTQRLKPGLPIDQARADIRALTVWKPLNVSAKLIESCWDIQDQYHYSWWDSLILTAAQFLDCRYLISEDMQHQQRIGELTILNPFITDFEELK